MGLKMISRTLLVALACTCARAGTLSAGDDDCALYLSGPGRTSAYDYSLNLLKGNFGYEGQHTCITYDAVNRAYHEARNRILVSQPKGDWKPEDFASVGELILDISINLARTYGLTYEEIEKGLPLIDTSRTLIREVCPPVFSHVECRAGKYRRLDGLCNNLQHPTWGATNAPFQRLIGPLFSDGINAPRISHTGRELPLSRVVSRTMHPDDGFHDHAGTVMVIAWGQFMDHDYTLTGTPLDPVSRNDPEECCKRPPHLKHPYCNEIRIPDDDYFYRLFGVKCIDFVRGFPSPRPGCRLGSRVPFNTLTGAIDGNTVYGVTDKFARKLRTGYGGLLRMNPVFKEYGLKDLLPLKLDIPDEGCTRPNKHMYCFEAGEIRVNEQLVLTVMHTLMAREHNRVAGALGAVNPHWDDETLYQEARRINIAEIQHITYNEFLPILLGKDVMEKFGLVLEKEGFWEGYDPHVNPDVLASFASAAYRFGHSLLPTAVERWSKAHKFIASKRLSDLIRRPYDLYRAGVLDEYVMGLMNQVAQAMDDSITQEVTNHLFKKVGARFGMDLVSFNMQRGREFGIPGYMEFRKFCGLSGADSFQDLFGTMSNDTVRKYETIFEHPIDVDLWSGGVSERPLPGSMLGPTFACVIATQFSYSRRGDRFWFELPHQPSSFTPEQLHEIRKSRLARVICDNTDIIDTVQLYPMVLPDHELNPRVPCRSGIIPTMDFTKWAEPAPFHSAKQFMTDAYILPRNETNCDENGNRTAINCKNHIIATKQSCGCNYTVDIAAQNKTDMKEQLETNSSNSSNKTDFASTIHDCAEKVNDTSNCVETQIKSNIIRDSDTVLKYVYKKDDKVNISDKTKAHPKNSVKRRKRALYDPNEDARYAASVPLIVNYKTSHPPQGEKPFERIRNVIQNSDLADFNIETLHENIQPNKNSEDIKDKSKKVYFEPKPLQRPLASEEIDDKDEYRDNTKRSKPHKDSVENDEGNGHRNRENDPPRERESDESDERSDYIDSKTEPLLDRNRKDYRENVDSGEVIYREDNREPSHVRNRKAYSENKDSGEKSDYRDSKRPFHNKNNKSYKDTEDSSETGDYKNNKNKSLYDRNSKPYRDSNESSERNDYREHKEHPRNRDKKPYTESEESSERSNSREGKREPSHNRDRYASDENENSRNKASYSAPRTDSSETREGEQSEEFSDAQGNNKQSYATPPRDSNESRESKQSEESSNPKRANSKESQESQESDESYYKPSKSDYTKPRDHLTESKENYKDEEKPSFRKESSAGTDSAQNSYYKNNDNSNILPDNNEDSEEEEIIAIMKRKNRKAFNKPRENHRSENKGQLNTSLPIKIKDVDLDDFSYERIHVNDKGIVETTKDTHENYETDTQVEIAPTKTQIPQAELIIDGNQYSRSIESIDAPSGASILLNNDEISEDSKGPIINKINNGEVRPVVEINSESGELNDENSKEDLKSRSGNEDTSLETLLGVKLPDGNEQNDKIDLPQIKQENADVKQQFERIPLNYNHDQNMNQSDDKSNSKPVHTSKVDNDDVTHNQGTLDVLTPNEHHDFDENLNIKFDDLTIRLPEIRLPKDILAYTYEEPAYEKHTDTDKGKPFYRYSDEYNSSEEKPREKKKNDDYNDDHHGYSDYYGKSKKKDSYKKKQQEEDDEEDEDVDLYEKFVRERFGKRGSFEKRSEKLQDSRPVQSNPQLYNTLRQVLKKTEDIEKQAVKSGDPNAGYMWTLEYGQAL